MTRLSSSLKKPKNQGLLFIIIVLVSYVYLSRPIGYARDVKISGNLAFLAVGQDGLRVVDISDPGNPNELGWYNSPGSAQALYVEGHYAYLAAGRRGLQIVDVSNPEAPVLVGSLNTPGNAEDVVVIGNIAYVADGKKGLRTIDVSVPYAPIELRDSALALRASRVVSRGDLLLVIDNKRNLRIVKLQNRRKPELSGNYSVGSNIADVYITGDTAYLATEKNGIVVINISNPDQVSQVSQIPVPISPLGIKISGNFAYLVDGAGLRILDLAHAAVKVQEVGFVPTKGEANKLVVGEPFVYIADGFNGLTILKPDILLNPEELGTSAAQLKTEDVYKEGAYLYLAAAERGVRVLDGSNLSRPRLVGAYDTAGYAMSIVVSGDRAFVADRAKGLLVLEASRPAEIGRLSSQAVIGHDVFDVAVSGDYAYLADGKFGMAVIGFTSPLEPIEASRIALPGTMIEISILGKYAYLAAGEEGVRVVNISDPLVPVQAGFYKAPGTANTVALIAINDATAAANGGDRYIVDLNHPETRVYAFVGFGSGMRVLNITNPAVITQVGFLELGGAIQDVKVIRDKAYVANSLGLIQVVDVSNLAQPKLLGSAGTPGQAHGLSVDGPLVYVADFERGLRVVDASVPDKPAIVGFYDAPATVKYVATKGSYAYLVDGQRGMWVMDVTNPQKPVEVGSFNSSGTPVFVTVADTRAYLADGSAGIQVLQISDPSSPQTIGHKDTPGYANAVAVRDNLIFVADGNAGLRILDQSNTAAIQELGSFQTPGPARRVALSNEYVYLACGEGGLAIVKASDPKTPVKISNYDLLKDVRGVVVSDNYVFLAAGLNGFRVLDVSHPLAPKELEIDPNFQTLLPAEDIVLLDNYIFLSIGLNGFRILDITDPTRPVEVGSSSDTANVLGLSALWREAVPDKGIRGQYQIFAADDDQGLKTYQASKAVSVSLTGIYETPGMATVGQIMSMLRSLLLFQFDDLSPKAVSTVLRVLFDVFVLGVVGLFFWLYLISNYVLPVASMREHYMAYERLTYYLFGQHGPAVHVKNGKIIQHAGEEKRQGPGVALVDISSAIVLERRHLPVPFLVNQALRIFKYSNKFIGRLFRRNETEPAPPLVRAKGPGLVFTGYQGSPNMPQWHEKVRGVVDLRSQFRLRPHVQGYTKDGIEVSSNIFSIFTLGQPPDVLKVTYHGARIPENLRVIHLEERPQPNPPGRPRLVQVIKGMTDELDAEDKFEIHRFVQAHLRTGQQPPEEPDWVQNLTNQPYYFDADRVFAAIFGRARDDKGEGYVDWTELTVHVATEIFRDMLLKEPYDRLYLPIHPTKWPMQDLKRQFRIRVRNLGVLAFKFFDDPQGNPLKKGQVWDENQLDSLPIQELKQPKILRSRGIKVVFAGFSELNPGDAVREQMLDSWAAKWDQDVEKTKADHERRAIIIYNQARAAAQRELIDKLMGVINAQGYSKEALAFRVLQALETVAADPTTRQMLPETAIETLRNLQYWLR